MNTTQKTENEKLVNFFYDLLNNYYKGDIDEFFMLLNFYFDELNQCERIVSDNHVDLFHILKENDKPYKIGIYNPIDPIATIDHMGYLVSFSDFQDAKDKLFFNFFEMSRKMASRQYRSIFIEYLND